MKLFRNFMALVAALLMFTACGDDDDKKETVVKPVTFQGTITSCIPARPDFTPSEYKNSTMVVTWEQDGEPMVTLHCSQFDVEIPQMGRAITIGEMTIPHVKMNGEYGMLSSFVHDDFTCQAGEYEVKGAVAGTFANGKATIVFTYKPGSMPLEVQSVFEGTANNQ